MGIKVHYLGDLLAGIHHRLVDKFDWWYSSRAL